MPGGGLLSGAGRPDAAVFVLSVGEVMAVCTYDNPATMNRECWENKKSLVFYSCRLLPPFAKEPIPEKYLFFGANIGAWRSGQLVGDPDAMNDNALISGFPLSDNVKTVLTQRRGDAKNGEK